MSITSGGITEFLNELAESDALAALKEAYSSRSPFVFKVEGVDQPTKAYINSFADKKIFLTTEPGINLPTDKEISLKFLVGTEVYFIKTIFKLHMNRFYIDMNAKVIQLKRRKEPRFLIPKGWNQSGAILLPKGAEVLNCNVMDISKSGVRFEIIDPVKIPFHRDDIIKIKFQVHKRGEVATTAIVRFFMNRPNSTALMGLEFANITEVQNERVASIVDDIQMFNSTHKT
jgi:hypothetical protein